MGFLAGKFLSIAHQDNPYDLWQILRVGLRKIFMTSAQLR
jgi:hypothetical protein